jgi:hypothetical protein
MDQDPKNGGTRSRDLEGSSSATVSARKLKSNRENSKQSTGPKTARGKTNSRFNALKHGLCAKRFVFSADGKLLEEDLLTLLKSLQEQYSSDDVRVQLLCDAIVKEYWRQGQGLRLEMKFLNESDMHFTNRGGMGLLQRYLTGSQRALIKNLELLNKIQPQLPSTPQPTVNALPGGAADASKGRASKRVGENGHAHAAVAAK